MSFLAPWLLLLGAAAGVPLLLHLLRRRIGQRVEFPAARYLARMEREHSRSLRMRNLLLMLLRVLVIVLAALAAARPMTRWFGRGHGPTALALVLDNSMSTGVVQGGHPLFEELRARALDALAAATPDDRVWLVTADGTLRGGTPAELRTAVRQLATLGGAGNPALAVARAASAVASSGLPARQVAVLTDGQKTAWRTTVEARGAPVVAYMLPGAPPVNRAVIAADAQPAHWTPGGAIVARVFSRDSVTWRIALGDRTLARGTVGPGEEVSVHASPPERGWIGGRVEIDPDELDADDARAFAVWVGAPPGVRVLSGAGPFADNAVGVLRGTGRVASGADVTVASADELAALPALIVAPSDPVRIGAANRTLERLGIPWRFGAARRDPVTVRTGDLGRVDVALRYTLERAGAAPGDTIALAGAEPWMVGGPRYVLVASPLDPSASTLPVSATFVPWLADVLAGRLTGEAGRAIAATPGQHLAWPSWADALEGRDGVMSGGADFTAPAQSGTWFFTRGGRRVGALVVNPEPDESALDRLAPADLARALGRDARVVTTADAWRDAVFSASSRRSIVAPLLFFLLVALAVEGVLSARGGSEEH